MKEIKASNARTRDKRELLVRRVISTYTSITEKDFELACLVERR